MRQRATVEVLSIVRELAEEGCWRPVREAEVLSRACERGLSMSEARRALKRLLAEGEVYMPAPGFVKLVGSQQP